MRRQSAVILIIALIPFLLVLGSFAQEDMVVVEGDSFKNQRRPAAVFRHDEHNELAEIEECNACHHIYENGNKLEDESSEDQSCSECHEESGAGKQPGLRRAFHINCKGCHLENKKGPVMCGQCHVR